MFNFDTCRRFCTYVCNFFTPCAHQGGQTHPRSSWGAPRKTKYTLQCIIFLSILLRSFLVHIVRHNPKRNPRYLHGSGVLHVWRGKYSRTATDQSRRTILWWFAWLCTTVHRLFPWTRMQSLWIVGAILSIDRPVSGFRRRGPGRLIFLGWRKHSFWIWFWIPLAVFGHQLIRTLSTATPKFATTWSRKIGGRAIICGSGPKPPMDTVPLNEQSPYTPSHQH